MPVHKVLIPLDTSELSEQILPAVRALFAPAETELTLLSVMPLMAEPAQPAAALANPTLDQEQWTAVAHETAIALQTQAEALQAAGFQVTTMVLNGDPVQQIIAALDEGSYDVLAMTTHGQTGAARRMLGSVAERVLRRIHVPLLLVRPFADSVAESVAQEQSLHRSASARPMTMATATDGSTHAQRARVLAQSLAQVFQAKLKAIVVADEHEDAATAQHLMQDVQQRLGDMAPAVELVPLVGRTDIVLERYFSEQPVDLLVIGAFRDRDAGAVTHIGFTAQQVVQHVPLSILVAKGFAPTLRKLLAYVTRDDEAVIKVAAQWASVLKAELRLLYLLPSVEQSPDPNEPRLADLPLNEIVTHGLFRHESRLADEVQTVSLNAALAEQNADAQALQTVLRQMANAGVPREALFLRRGPATQTVLYVAEQEHADLIVVGSEPQPIHFLDSVANAVVQLAPRSVLLVRTKSAAQTASAG